MLDSATRFFDGGSVGGGFAMQKSNNANVNIIHDDVAGCFINARKQGEPGGVSLQPTTTGDTAALVG